MPLSLSLGLGLSSRNTGGGAARYAPYVAPAGYRWEYVTDNGFVVTDRGEPVVDLLRAA